VNGPDDVTAFAVLLHPHPDYGGSRFHPFIDGLYHQLQDRGVGAVRFDFTSASATTARQQVGGALDYGSARWPDRPAVIVGYSFGAGVAAGVEDERLIGWFLLAPQTSALSSATIGADARPKLIAVPERDQYSPPAAVQPVIAGWRETTVTVVPGVDHFLGSDVAGIVDDAAAWVATQRGGPRPSRAVT
jgi:alpha/beta superfamily hydrolase